MHPRKFSLAPRIVIVSVDGSPLNDHYDLLYGTKHNVDVRNKERFAKLCEDLICWLSSGSNQKHELASKRTGVSKFLSSIIAILDKYKVYICTLLIVFVSLLIAPRIFHWWRDSIIDNKDQGLYESGYENGYAWVDLGLHVKWATMNIGASTSSEFGAYYAWGETLIRKIYSWDTHKVGFDDSGSYYTTDVPDITMYTPDSGKDVARENWGGNWRVPSSSEFKELCEECTWTWTTVDGCTGCQVTGPNGNAIFLPAAGYRVQSDANGIGEEGNYITCEINSEDRSLANILIFDNSNHRIDASDRVLGFSVRPVLDKY